MFIYIICSIIILIIISIIVLTVLIVKKPDFFNKNIKNGRVISADDGETSNTAHLNGVIGDVKDFLPFVGFEDFAIDLGGHNYRAIVEASSINFSLMTENEQLVVEKSFQMCLDAISFPFVIYVQTREYALNDMLNNLEDNIYASVKRFPELKSYADNYYAEMKKLPEYINNSKIKKKYIIIPYNSYDLQDVSALTNDEIKEFALEELYNRCSIVMSGLSRVGLDASVLDKRGIAECLYSYYHRNEYQIASDIASGYYNTLTVKGANGAPTEKDLDLILSETQNEINTRLRMQAETTEEINLYTYIIDILEKCKYSGIYSKNNSGETDFTNVNSDMYGDYNEGGDSNG